MYPLLLLDAQKLEKLVERILRVERRVLLDQASVELAAGLYGNVSPDNSQETARQGHPHDRDSRRHTRRVVSKVQLGKQESKGGRLHGSLNGHGTSRSLSESSQTRQNVSDKSTEQVQEKDRNLELDTGIEDRFRHLSDRTGYQQARRDDTDDRSEGQDLLDKAGEELVGGHTDDNRSQDDLCASKCKIAGHCTSHHTSRLT